MIRKLFFFVSVILSNGWPQAALPPECATTIIQVPIETTLIEEKGLIANAAIAYSNESVAEAEGLDRADLPNGARLYALIILPGETLEILRTTEHENSISMKIVPPSRTNALSRDIERVNRQPKAVRSKRISIKNYDKQDAYKIILQVFGRVGIPYSIKINRSKG